MMTSALHDLGLYCMADEQRPWVPFLPYSELVSVKLCRVDPYHDEFITVLRAPPGVELPPFESSGPTVVYTLQGRWKYREEDWVAGPGSLVTEGDSTPHTLFVLADGTDDAVLVTLIEGKQRFLDPSGNLIGSEDWRSASERYIGFCRQHGISPPPVAGLNT